MITDAQFREVQFSANIAEPKNVHLHLDDFCKFKIANTRNFKNVVTIFFIDTAENILEYFDKINALSAP